MPEQFQLRCVGGYEHFVRMNMVARMNWNWWVIVVFLSSSHPSSALNLAGTYTAWGVTNLVTTNSPVAIATITQIAAGGFHGLALREDQTVAAWGDNTYSQTNLPANLTNVITISAGAQHSLAVLSDGTVVAWGRNLTGQTNVPAGLNGVIAVAAGSDHSVALRSNGTVVAWGTSSALTNVPPGTTNIIAIASGSTATLALRSNGTVVAWGQNTYSLTNLPAGLTNIIGISIGLEHCLALRSNGVIVSWGGANTYGQTTVPATVTNVIAVSAGWLHSMAMRSDGKLLAWGLSTSGQTTVPASLTNIGSFSAGNGLSLAIDLAPKFISKPAAVVTLSPGQTNLLSVTTLSGAAASLQWFFNSAILINETNTDLSITGFNTVKAGVYSVTLSNQFSSTSATTIVRMTNAPTIQVNSVLIGGGGVVRTNSATITLTATTNAYPKLHYTLDGSEPDFTSPAYSIAFVISNSATVRAVAYNNLVTDKFESAPLTVQVIPTYTLTTNGGGGGISINPAPNIAPNFYLSNTVVTLTASPNNGWSFMYWTGAVTSTDSVINVLMDQPRNVLAVFGTTLNLFTNGNGNIVTEPPLVLFPYGSNVTLTALPNVANYFFGWAGFLSGFSNPVKLTVTNATGITALFGALTANQVSLVALPVGGGSLSFSPARNVYTNGEVVTLSALSTSNRIFSAWSGDASGAANPLVLTLNSSKLIYGSFIPGVSTNVPVFVLLPGGRSLSAGDNTVLSALATGVGPLLYQWRLNGITVSGATSSNLFLNNVTASKAGFYDVVVNGAFGTSVSPSSPVALFDLEFAAGLSQAFPLLIMDCAPGARFNIQYSGDLRLTNWTLLAPITMTSSRNYFIDTTPTNSVRRFYRLVPN